MYQAMLVEFIINIADVSLLLYFVSRFIKLKEERPWRIGLAILAQVLINTYVNHSFGTASIIGLCLMTITTGIIFYILFKAELVNIYVLVIHGLILMFIMEAAAVLMLLLMGKLPAVLYQDSVYRIFGAVLSKSLYFIVTKYLIRRLKSLINLNKMRAYQIILVSIFNIIIIFMTFCFYKYTPDVKQHVRLYILLMTAGAVIFSVAILAIIRGIIKQSQKELEWELKENEYKSQAFYMENIEGMLQTLRSERHEFNNHINCLYGLIKLDKHEDAKYYIENLTEEIAHFNETVNTGNPILTAMLNVKLTVIEHEKIEMDTDISLPSDINIEPMDLSIIVGNLLDNAIEACKAAGEGKKSINLKIYTKENNLIIKVNNTKAKTVKIDEKALETGFSTKQDGADHGYGLSNIRQTVNKYNGIVKLEDEGENFRVNIALPLKKTASF